MVAAGVLPIDRITDRRGPVDVVARNVPRADLESIYHVKLALPAAHEAADRPPTAAEVLRAYARSRGHVVSSGLPDEARAARQILKDYLSGKLPHFELPPGCPRSKAWYEARGRGEGEVEGGEGGGNSVPGMGRLGISDTGSSRGDVTGSITGSALQPGDEIALSAAQLGSSRVGGGLVAGQQGQPQQQGGRQRRPVQRAEHKMHRKVPRKKDRTWRVGRGDDSDGMPVVSGVARPLSHGAAGRASVLPSQRHLVQ